MQGGNRRTVWRWTPLRHRRPAIERGKPVRPRPPPGAQGVGGRERRQPGGGCRSLLESRAGRPPCALRHLTAQVPESPRIQPQLRCHQDLSKVAACREFTLGRPRMTAWEPTRRSPRPQKPCKSQPSDLRGRRAGRQLRSHKSRAKTLQTRRIMELGGLEPPTSWVRSTSSAPGIDAKETD
jgi:hypothetical protein